MYNPNLYTIHLATGQEGIFHILEDLALKAKNNDKLTPAEARQQEKGNIKIEIEYYSELLDEMDEAMVECLGDNTLH